MYAWRRCIKLCGVEQLTERFDSYAKPRYIIIFSFSTINSNVDDCRIEHIERDAQKFSDKKLQKTDSKWVQP